MEKRSVNMLGRLLLIVLTFVIAAAPGAKADEVGDLKAELKVLQQRIEQLEAKQKQQDQQIEEKVTKAVDEKKVDALPDALKWVKKVKIYGDLRYRHETIEAEADAKADRHRNRIRARIGLDAKVNDEWDAKFRIASGSSPSRTSTNQTLDTAFTSKDIWLDLAYGAWHPESWSDMNVWMGKMENPLYKVGKNQLIWDGDLNPEGIAGKYRTAMNEETNLFVNGGGFWVDEIDGATMQEDAALWAIQGGFDTKLSSGDTLIAGATYCDYTNLDNAISLTTGGAGTAFDTDFTLVELFGELKTKLGDTPFSIHGNHVTNIATDSGLDKGWLIGATYNKAKKPGSWQLVYDYRELQEYAVPGALTDSDFIGGGTDGKGHRFGGAYQFHKNAQFALTYFLNERTNTSGKDLDYRTLQADIKLKF